MVQSEGWLEEPVGLVWTYSGPWSAALGSAGDLTRWCRQAAGQELVDDRAVRPLCDHPSRDVGFEVVVADRIAASRVRFRRTHNARVSRPRIRVAAYVIRHRAAPELLVFDHVGMPQAPTQVPSGGVQPGEDLEQAVVREVFEGGTAGIRQKGIVGSRCSWLEQVRNDARASGSGVGRVAVLGGSW